MDFALSEVELDFRRSVRDWLEATYPKAAVNALERQEDMDGTGFPHQLWRDVATAGYFGVGVDERLGGQGGRLTEQVLLMAELARNLAGLSWIWAIPSLCARALQRCGRAELRDALVPRIVDGSVRTAIAITEPAGGTDLLRAMGTTARPADGGYRLSGAKTWSTMAHVADYLLVLARTGDGGPPTAGKTLFLVPTDQPGVVARPIPKLGMRCLASCEVAFEDAFVPASHVVGEADRGWHDLLGTLNGERVLVGALSCGILRGVLEDALTYAGRRQAFGRTIGSFQVIQHWIADMAMHLEQAELMTFKAAWLVDQDRDAGVASSMAKTVASEYAAQAADRGIQILGGMGYAAELDMQRYWRDARLYQIAPVTNQMTRNYIGESLGLDRSF